MKHFVLKTNNNDYLLTINNFFKMLLEKSFLDMLMVPQDLPGGVCASQTLVKDTSKVLSANPFIPVLMGNSATLVSELTYRPELNKKIGVVLRPCEIRALVELVKLKQINRDGLIIISVDCLGTYEVEDYEKLTRSGRDSRKITDDFISNSQKPVPVRNACRGCEYPRAPMYDINIGFIGHDLRKEMIISANNNCDAILSGLGLEPISGGGDEKDIESIKQKRAEFKKGLFNELNEKIKQIEGVLDILSTCKKCYNCRRACPICYCKECIMCSSTFEYEMRNYTRWVDRKGSVKMPTDTLLFHLTRMNHMATSCVSCGQCTSACPSRIQIGDMFSMIGSKAQALFNYVPGRSLEEELPQTTFREDELKGV